MAKRLHDLVVAAKKNSAFPFGAGQYLTKFIRDQMSTAQVGKVKFIKLEPRVSTSQMEELVHLNKSSYMATRLMESAEVLEKPDELAVQLEVLQKANTDLQAQLENYKTQLATVTIRYGEEKTKWVNLPHDNNQNVTTTKVALRSAESKITNLELQLQLANSRISQVGTASSTNEIMHMVDMRGKGVALEVGQPSGMHGAEKEASPLEITANLLLDLTEYVPPTSNVEHGYAFDRQVLFLVLNLNWRETLSNSQFRTVWSRACYYNLENLLLEVILKGDSELEDYGAAYSQIGDFGLKRLLYYSKLESDLAMRHSTAQVAYEGRTILLLGKELTKLVGPAITK
jgi:hypothetical protein